MTDRRLDAVIRLLGLAVTLGILLVGCGTGLPTGPSNDTVERGEANAINPARNVHLVCETTKNQNAGTTVNITNNCNKNNTEAPVVVTPE